jgi:hypothetical protein
MKNFSAVKTQIPIRDKHPGSATLAVIARELSTVKSV